MLFSCNHQFPFIPAPSFCNWVTKGEKKVYKHPCFYGSKVISSSMKACRQLALNHNQEAVVERRGLRRNFLDNVWAPRQSPAAPSSLVCRENLHWVRSTAGPVLYVFPNALASLYLAPLRSRIISHKAGLWKRQTNQYQFSNALQRKKKERKKKGWCRTFLQMENIAYAGSVAIQDILNQKADGLRAI